ncbi:hypothetical protein FB00_06825 [Cellulosimicrobium funkei]|uniref:PglD N-terminal domain-containing protein n=1 Tax=Cellulosimicrobium funkei TaxID=264251 RepID=A0A0H2KUL9_9MICO|nr:NeuD/PglB/VioB family sugar acetyltransferase [Cellulosimicrobium funkei]KLN35479.1 hypothetical protein FB00_06825 [Cellulosimicrobium funkei]
MTALILLGGGGHARSAADVATRLGRVVRAVVAPGGAPGWTVPVVDTLDEVETADAELLVCIGDNAVRSRVTAEVEGLGLRLGTLVARTATAGSPVAAGTQILEHAHVGPGASVGRGVIVNTRATVEHDCAVGDFAHVAPGATLLGSVSIGACTLVGAGATVLPGVQVGADAVIAAGAVVVRDVAPGRLVRGVPARALDR